MKTSTFEGRAIISTVRTYKQTGGKMVHDGYFFILKNDRLRWGSKWQYKTMLELMPTHRVRVAYSLPVAGTTNQ